MDVNRNQWFLAGLVVIMLGLQFRMVDWFVLTPQATQILAERMGHPAAPAGGATETLLKTKQTAARRTLRPPDWLGWSLLSIGCVCVLHSLAMARPA